MSAIIQVSIIIITLFIDICFCKFIVDFSWMIALAIKTKTTIQARTPRDCLRLQISFLSFLNSMELVLKIKFSAFRYNLLNLLLLLFMDF